MMKHLGRSVPLSAIALAIAALLISLIGCGGRDSTAASIGSSPTARITKEELIERGDAICRRTDSIQERAAKLYEEKHGKPTKINLVAKELSIVALPPIKTEIEELSALGAPEGGEDQVRAIINGLEKALEDTERNPYSMLQNNAGEFTGPDKLARDYGFEDCADAL